MADNKNNDGPTIGERIGSTIVQGVKQGVIGIAAGGAAGAALGAVAGYAADSAGDVLKEGATKFVQSGALNDDATRIATQQAVEAAQDLTSAASKAGVVSAEAAKTFTENTTNFSSFASHETGAEMIDKLTPTLDAAVDTIQSTAVKAGAAVGAAVGGAGMGAKGAAEGLLNGSPTKHAERVAAKGTRRGIESIIQEAMERGQQEQAGFVQAVEKERSSKGATPPTLAV